MNFHKIFIAGFIWCGILLSLQSYGQSPHLQIPLGAMPMQYNPSFAGEAGAGRLSSVATHSNLYTGRSDRRYRQFHHKTFGIYTSYDQFIPSLGTGIGITTGYDGSRITSYRDEDHGFISLAVAPKISIKGKYTLSPSVNISHGMTEADYDNSVSVFPGTELLKKVRSTSSTVGLLFNASKYYIGYSVILINKYDLKNEKGEKIVNNIQKGFESWLQMGYTFQKSSESKFSFTPQLVFSISDKQYFKNNLFTLHAINLNFRYKQYIAGLNNTGIQLGFQNERLRLMFSSGYGILSPWEGAYAFRTSPYYDRPPMNGNLSFRYIFKNTGKGLDQSRF